MCVKLNKRISSLVDESPQYESSEMYQNLSFNQVKWEDRNNKYFFIANLRGS